MTTASGGGRPHLGPRHVVTARVSIPARDGLDEIAARFNTDRSTVLADLAAAAAGLPDQARRIRFDIQIAGAVTPEEGLPLAM
jgi:hypothetical protein